ncbi:MAG: TonB-dependent receptor domain-containing protein [Acidobacteriota bacterium]
MKLLRLFLFVTLFFSVWLPAGTGKSASIQGTTTTQKGTVYLPGVELTLLETVNGRETATTLSDDEGRFSFIDLPPGSYRIRASLPGFSDFVREPVVAAEGQVVEVRLDLQVARIQESVQVVARRKIEIPDTGTSQQELGGEMIDVAPVPGEDFRDLLPLVPGVVRSTDGRLSIKGGRPTQNSLLINGASVSDPSTSEFGAHLPADAIDSVDILPNPYATEYGRFSAGLVQIQTVQGTDKWHFTGNNFAPRFKRRKGPVMGVGSWTPRLGFRGPLVKDRLFMAQSFNYRFVRTLTRSPRLPELEADSKLESFLSFTQLDANLGDRHTLSATFSMFPQKLGYVNLDSFHPQEVTPNLNQRGFNLALREAAALSPSMILETILSYTHYEVDIFGQGHEAMEIAPESSSGNFFNQQNRQTQTLQFRQSLNLQRQGWGGEHLIKLGVDLLASRFDGSSRSRDINVRRADGRLSQKIEFGEPTSQRVRGTDVALFVQDRWRLHDRLLLEPGVRLDRDGVLERTNVAPRFGFVLELFPENRGVLRGGAGRFNGRTPLNVGAFESFDQRAVTYFDTDGSTPLGPPILYAHQAAPHLRTPYSIAWNLEYDHRVNRRLVLKTNFLRREGFHEYLIEPIESEPQALLRLDSSGRSRYWEWELTTHYTIDEDHDLIFSYVRSRSRQDLNSFDHFFGNFRQPIIRPNEYSLGPTDTPNRFLVRGTLPLFGKWQVSPLMEIRDGFPYSRLNQAQEFVGARNRAGRFRRFASLDLSFMRWIRVKGMKARLGFRVFNLTNRFNPRDVQENIDAASFGTFYNSPSREFGATFQIVQ